MFSFIKELWLETAISSAIEGVIRESSKGNKGELTRWYFKVKKEAYKQSIKEGIPASAIEERVLKAMRPEQLSSYQTIVDRFSQEGGPLEEVNEWLKTNKPI